MSKRYRLLNVVKLKLWNSEIPEGTEIELEEIKPQQEDNRDWEIVEGEKPSYDSPNFNIFSVKRKSDGEVFSIGDMVDDNVVGEYEHRTIERFYIRPHRTDLQKDEMWASTKNPPGYDAIIEDFKISNIKKSKPQPPSPKKEFSNLKHGVYRIFWKSGGISLASVGSTHDGTRWFAPCNWVSEEKKFPKVTSTDWGEVERVELIEENNYSKASPKKERIGEDNICPITKKPCDDETCTPGAECNLSGGDKLSEVSHKTTKFKIKKIKELWYCYATHRGYDYSFCSDNEYHSIELAKRIMDKNGWLAECDFPETLKASPKKEYRIEIRDIRIGAIGGTGHIGLDGKEVPDLNTFSSYYNIEVSKLIPKEKFPLIKQAIEQVLNDECPDDVYENLALHSRINSMFTKQQVEDMCRDVWNDCRKLLLGHRALKDGYLNYDDYKNKKI